ncbi:MAG TPA: ABC transporter permease [Solirubrobacteraceae bacterium]|jgi:ABC-type spermidine/putrescine transport system permease subunit II|nr:ABC transporter permease [Solirubrobacteraceae bacterium]
MAGEIDGVEIVARRGRLVRRALTGWGCLMYLFLFVPVLLLVLLSFNRNRYGSFPITGLTTEWYTSVLQSSDLQDAIKTSLGIAAEVTAISVIVGTAAAFPLVRSRLRFRAGLRVAFTLPIMIPGVLIGVSLLSFFTNVLGLQLTTQTAVIGQSVYTTPYVLLIVSARLAGFDRSLESAASDLGANAFQRFRRIVLPLIAPAIFAGALFSFTMSLDEFVITYFIIGAQITLPIYIYTQIKFGITPAVNAVATILIVGSLGISGLGIAVPRMLKFAVRRLRRLQQGRRARPVGAV